MGAGRGGFHDGSLQWNCVPVSDGWPVSAGGDACSGSQCWYQNHVKERERNEGLSVPQNRSEFEAVLAALKAKGYTPVQGPADKIYADLTAGMVFSSLCEGQPVYEALKAGDEEAAGAALSPAVELVDELVAKGYTDAAVNVEYPEDNYDQAILRFFEGDVPFWMCNTEKVSGMKKRESKSEAFQKAPFSYAFIYPPLGGGRSILLSGTLVWLCGQRIGASHRLRGGVPSFPRYRKGNQSDGVGKGNPVCSCKK